MYTVALNLDGVVNRLLETGFCEVRLADGSVRVCFAGAELRQAGTNLRAGDRVVVGAEENGVFRGEILRVKPEPPAARRAPQPRASLITRSAPDGLKPQDLKVNRAARPDWPTAAECTPRVGDTVYCTAGPGTVLRVLGRTGNGSRLLELRLFARGSSSFFAAGANVLLAPPGCQLAAEAAAGAAPALGSSGLAAGGR